MSFVSSETWEKLNKLSLKQLRLLADLMGVGFNLMEPEEVDKDTVVMILSTEPEDKVIGALKRLQTSLR